MKTSTYEYKAMSHGSIHTIVDYEASNHTMLPGYKTRKVSFKIGQVISKCMSYIKNRLNTVDNH